MNQGIAGIIFSSCKGNTAIAHRDIFREFDLKSIVFFYDADVIGCRKFTGSAKNVEDGTIDLSNRAIFGRIVTGEFQVYFPGFSRKIRFSCKIINFKAFVVITFNGQCIIFKRNSINILISKTTYSYSTLSTISIGIQGNSSGSVSTVFNSTIGHLRINGIYSVLRIACR